MTDFFIQKGGPATVRQADRGGYPKLLVSPNHKLQAAAHNMGRTYSDRISIDMSDDNQTAYLQSEPWAVGDVIVLHNMPMAAWMQYWAMRIWKPTDGLTFNVVTYDTLPVEINGNNQLARNPANIKKQEVGEIDTGSEAIILAGVNANVDLDADPANQWAGQYVWTRDTTSFMKKNAVVALKITAVPAEGVFGSDCRRDCIGIDSSIVYTDSCFIESFFGEAYP